MKLTSRGYRITKNGNVIKTIEKEAFKSDTDLGASFKHESTYYFFNRKQGETFVYLP